MEGGARMAQTIRYLSDRGIPVMGHIGLTPQMFNVMGGFKTQGRSLAEWPAIEADARAVAESGAFAVVLEGMAEPLAAQITRQIAIPTIGIGASADCDGQILVMEDMLGLNPNPPRFVRQYANLGPEIEAAVKAYAADVRERRFPGTENVYPMKKAG
jgi:3-methyl-2-oxobutanoate hydroxymethyltransferase